MTLDTQPLLDFLETETRLPYSGIVQELADAIRADFLKPEGIQAIILYGSGLWQEEDEDTVWDLYVLSDSYGASTQNPALKFAGAMLAPNVYYIDKPAHCKYAVMRMDQFTRGARGKVLRPQIWARFAQPCRIVYARDEASRRNVLLALCDAVLTFHRKTMPLLDNHDDARALWVTGLQSTYSAELRSEKPGRAEQIFDTAPDAFVNRTELTVPCITAPRATSAFLRPFIKAACFVQLVKSALTFKGSVDYALWKIERHSGVRVEATDFQRNYPLIGAWPLVWKIYRKGGFR